MERTYSRINWENYNSTATPLGATNLNKMDAAIYTIDGEVVGMDTTKANQSDLLTCLSGVNYNTTTGVFTFTYKNGTSVTADLNVEKIPVSFSMSADGIITMTTADGTTYTADVGSLIKAYTFENTSEITWTVTTDADGNKAVTPALVDGGIAESKLQTNFLADCRSNRLESEGYAVGTQNGVPVAEGSPYYQNNSKYYKDALGDISQKLSKLDSDGKIDYSDVKNKTCIENPTTKADGQVLTYRSGSWVAEDTQGVSIEEPTDLEKGIVGGDAWSNTKTYSVGDACISGNKIYGCKLENSNIQPPNADYWEETSLSILRTNLENSKPTFFASINQSNAVSVTPSATFTNNNIYTFEEEGLYIVSAWLQITSAFSEAPMLYFNLNQADGTATQIATPFTSSAKSTRMVVTAIGRAKTVGIATNKTGGTITVYSLSAIKLS